MTLIARETRDNAGGVFSDDGERVYTIGLYVSAWRTSTLERLFRLGPTVNGFALQPGGDKLLAVHVDGTCDLLDGRTGETISSMPDPDRPKCTTVGLSACGRFAVLVDLTKIFVRDLVTGETVWRREENIWRLVPIHCGREWVLMHQDRDRQLPRRIDVWHWPFGSAPDRSLELPGTSYYPAIHDDRIALENYRDLRAFSLIDGRELFSVVTGSTAQSKWRRDGSLTVLHKESLNEFTWSVDVYDPSGHLVVSAKAPRLVIDLAVSPARDDVLLSFVNGNLLIRDFCDHARANPQLSMLFEPRKQNAQAYAFDTTHYPDDAEELEAVEGDTVEEIVAALTQYKIPTWTPLVSAERGPIVGSKFGGVPWIAPGEKWPRCDQCGGLMDLYLQLNSDELPHDSPRLFEGLLQVFRCDYESLDGDLCQNCVPFSNAAVVRVCRPQGPPAYDDLASDDLFQELRIVGWQRRQDDVPDVSELRTLGLELSEEQETLLEQAGLPYEGDKLLGWPAWQQQVEHHRCPQCSTTMRPIFQLCSNEHIPVMLGDCGRGWVVQCPEHTDVVAFSWTF